MGFIIVNSKTLKDAKEIAHKYNATMPIYRVKGGDKLVISSGKLHKKNDNMKNSDLRNAYRFESEGKNIKRKVR